MLSKREQRLNRELTPDQIVKQRLTALGYYDSGDDSGGGSALDSILASATQLTSTYIQSKNQPQYVSPPVTTAPAYGAATPFLAGGTAGSGSILLILILALVIGGGIYAFRG